MTLPRLPSQPPTAGVEGGARHLQFTLQSTVQSQWQKQKQWKVHSLLTITGRPLGAVREARSSHPGHLPLLPQLPGSCSGKPILRRPSDGLHASIFNVASRLTYQNPPVYLIPGSPGARGRVCQRKPPATALLWPPVGVGTEPEGTGDWPEEEPRPCSAGPPLPPRAMQASPLFLGLPFRTIVPAAILTCSGEPRLFFLPARPAPRPAANGFLNLPATCRPVTTPAASSSALPQMANPQE